MTFVGKVLVVIQLVMSLCFLAFAGAVYTAQENWKKNATTAKADLEKAKKEATEKENSLTTALAAKTTEANDQKARADGFQAQADNLNKLLATSQANEMQSVTASKTFQAAAETTSTEAVERKQEAQARQRVNQELHASRDGLLGEKRAMEDQIFGLKVEQERMLAKHEQILERMERYQRIMSSFGIDPETSVVATRQDPPPVVEGKVENTKPGDRGNSEFIEISIGSDDGLLRGHELFIYRTEDQGKYLGKIRLVLVTPDRSVGTVIEKARNGVIQKGDVVTSKL
jgi:hypothetical protein